MQFDQALDEGESRAESSRGTVGGALALSKQIECTGYQVGRHANTVVSDLDEHMLMSHFRFEQELPVLVRVFGGQPVRGLRTHAGLQADARDSAQEIQQGQGHDLGRLA